MALTLWAIVLLLIIPFYMFSQKELAPPEDQSFVFGIVQNPADASADQKIHFGRAVDEIFLNEPERELTFQLLFSPSDPMSVGQGVGGFAGMVTKPWAERERSIDELILDLISLDYHEALLAPSGHGAEEARLAAHRVVLLDLGAVVDGHVPAAEVDHAGAGRAMPGIQGGGLGQALSRLR